MASSPATICLLTRGESLELFRRCLESLLQHTPANEYELRLGFNQAEASLHFALGSLCPDDGSITRDTLPSRIERFSWTGPGGLMVHAYESPSDLAKETMVRLLFHDVPPVGEYVLWFDDDAYVSPGWWEALGPFMERKVDYFGRPRWVDYSPAQIAMIQSQPWYTGVPFLKRDGRLGGQFMRGFVGFRRQRLREVPVPEIPNIWKTEQLRGGACDVLFGEIARQMRWSQAGHESHIFFGADRQSHVAAGGNGRVLEAIA